VRTAAEAGTFGIIASESAPGFARIVLRIESCAIARGLTLLTGIVIATKAWTVPVVGAAPRSRVGLAMITGRARAGGDIRDECDAAEENKKCAETVKFHKELGIFRKII